MLPNWRMQKLNRGEEKLALLLCLVVEEISCRNAFSCRRLLTAWTLLACYFFFLPSCSLSFERFYPWPVVLSEKVLKVDLHWFIGRAATPLALLLLPISHRNSYIKSSTWNLCLNIDSWRRWTVPLRYLQLLGGELPVGLRSFREGWAGGCRVARLSSAASNGHWVMAPAFRPRQASGISHRD